MPNENFHEVALRLPNVLAPALLRKVFKRDLEIL